VAFVLSQHDPRWADDFRRLSTVLREKLRSLAVCVHHVGSTSIPGMLAKPILDIDVEIADGTSLDDVTAKLAELGYEHQGDLGIVGRHAYQQTRTDLPDHHLYVCRTSSDELRRHLHFRDALMTSAELRARYREVKEQAVLAPGGDRKRYQDEKERLGQRLFAEVLRLDARRVY
jgi:GrpB-like predicted nucleotidyltransferase (UPF0157 family)